MAGSKLHQQILCQHNHCQAFAAALGMPDNTALAIAVLVGFVDGFDDLFDGKILLIAAYLFDVGVKEDKVTDQLIYAVDAEQRNDIAVLYRRHTVGDHSFLLRLQPFRVLFFPYVPELFSGRGCRILDFVFIGCHYDLSKLKQLRNILGLLIADHLLNRLIDRNMRSLALDDSKRNTVDEQHDIRTRVVLLVLTVNGKFFGHMKKVFVEIIPVDISQVEAEQLAFADNLRIAFAEEQCVIDFFACAYKAVKQRLVKIFDRAFDIRGGKLVFGSGIGITVQPAQLTAENIFQQHMIAAATLLGAVLR